MKYIIRKILSMNELSLFTDSHGINETMALYRLEAIVECIIILFLFQTGSELSNIIAYSFNRILNIAQRF